MTEKEQIARAAYLGGLKTSLAFIEYVGTPLKRYRESALAALSDPNTPLEQIRFHQGAIAALSFYDQLFNISDPRNKEKQRHARANARSK